MYLCRMIRKLLIVVVLMLCNIQAQGIPLEKRPAIYEVITARFPMYPDAMQLADTASTDPVLRSWGYLRSGKPAMALKLAPKSGPGLIRTLPIYVRFADSATLITLEKPLSAITHPDRQGGIMMGLYQRRNPGWPGIGSNIDDSLALQDLLRAYDPIWAGSSLYYQILGDLLMSVYPGDPEAGILAGFAYLRAGKLYQEGMPEILRQQVFSAADLQSADDFKAMDNALFLDLSESGRYQDSIRLKWEKSQNPAIVNQYVSEMRQSLWSEHEIRFGIELSQGFRFTRKQLDLRVGLTNINPNNEIMSKNFDMMKLKLNVKNNIHAIGVLLVLGLCAYIIYRKLKKAEEERDKSEG